MENKYILQNNRHPQDTYHFNDFGEAVMKAMDLFPGGTISDATTGAILYVTYQQGLQKVFITTVNGEVRITETK